MGAQAKQFIEESDRAQDGSPTAREERANERPRDSKGREIVAVGVNKGAKR